MKGRTTEERKLALSQLIDNGDYYSNNSMVTELIIVLHIQYITMVAVCI